MSKNIKISCKFKIKFQNFLTIPTHTIDVEQLISIDIRK